MINDLLFYDLKIYQNYDAFKFSIDSILLAEYVKVNKNDIKIIDLCSGNLPIPFILNYKYNCNVDAIEIQKEIYNYGLESLELNNKKDYINYYNEDIKNIVIRHILKIVLKMKIKLNRLQDMK